MKKLAYLLGALSPLVATTVIFSYLAFARYQLGYWPHNGSQPQPSAFGYPTFHSIMCSIFDVCYFATLLWIGIVLILLAEDRKHLRRHKYALLLFVLGLCSFFLFRTMFEDHFLWCF